MDNLIWKPDPELARQSNMWRFMQYINNEYQQSLNDYPSLHQWSVNNKAEFWSSVWRYCEVVSSREWDSVIEQCDVFPGFQWFNGSRLNFAENLLRWSTKTPDKPALIFRGEDRIQSSHTFKQLHDRVVQLASALKSIGVKPGDRVAGYLPNMPETVIAMLATSSLGAIWSSCSPDFGVNGLFDRFGQIQPKVLFCADGYFFKGKVIDSLTTVEQVSRQINSLQQIIVVPYVNSAADINTIDNAVFYEEFVKSFSNHSLQFEQLPFNHPLYVMYSSGTTGKPKCIVHGVGGTLLQHLKEHVLHTDISEQDRVFYFTTCGWMMWNWLVSALATGATVMLYDGNPLYPEADSLFRYAEDEHFSVFGTSAKFLSAVEKAGAQPAKRFKLENLRSILSTGSPLLPESYEYVKAHIKNSVQLSSISGGTDIISCFALGNPLVPVYKGELQCIGLGMDVVIMDENGTEVVHQKGELCCKPPFPSMPVYFWDDNSHDQYRSAYFDKYPDLWAHGDYAEITSHNGLIIYGRSDAVLNPGGVRIGTAEIYRQVEKLPEIAESIVVGQDWENDTRVILFVKLQENASLDDDLKSRIKNSIRSNTTPRHVPAKIIAVNDIPRTISGKIVELAVRNVIHGRPVKNRDALANPDALHAFENIAELQEN